MTLRMTKEEYLRFHRKFCDDMVDITARKNADYTGDAADPFANFTVVERLGICSVEVGFLVRMSDKFIRIANLADGRGAQVKDEAVTDTLHDLANYSALFAGYLKSKSGSGTPAPAPPPAPPGRLQLRVGGRYRTRDGKEIHRIIRSDASWPWGGMNYTFESDRGQCFLSDGGFDLETPGSNYDLVEEVAE